MSARGSGDRAGKITIYMRIDRSWDVLLSVKIGASFWVEQFEAAIYDPHAFDGEKRLQLLARDQQRHRHLVH